MMKDCPDPSDLELLVTGKVQEPERRVLEEHLDTCSSCGRLVSEVLRVFASAGKSNDAGDSPLGAEQTATPVKLGRYELGKRLGSGGMGIVFEARDPQLDRRVALKLMHPSMRVDDATQARLLREARAMAQLAHPNVVTVHDVGRLGSLVFVAMELVEGQNLREWLAQRSPPTIAIVSAMVQAGRGLEAAHAAGLVHGDFKPDNVLVGSDGRARVTDFGLARADRATWPGPDGASPTEPRGGAATVTQTGALGGTPAYMAPEQLAGEKASAQTDQYAYCVTLLEALAGKHPFGGGSPSAAGGGQLPALAATLPRRFRRPILKGSQPRSADRYPSMSALLADLDRGRATTRALLPLLLSFAIGISATVAVLRWITLRASESQPDDRGQAQSVPGSAQAVSGQASVAPQPALPPSCEDPPVRRAWGAARRQHLEARLRELGVLSSSTLEPRSAAIWPALAPKLDAWAESYERSWVDSCRAEPETRARIRRCLFHRELRFDELLVELGKDERRSDTAVEVALVAADELPFPADCASIPLRDSYAPLPPDALELQRVTGLSRKLAVIEGQLSVGRTEAAGRSMDALLPELKRAGYPPLLADSLLVGARLAEREGKEQHAIKLLELAVELGRRAKHEVVVMPAALIGVEVEGATQLEPAKAERWVREAEQRIQVLDDPKLRADLAFAHGRMFAAVKRYDDAKSSFARARELRIEHFGETHPATADVAVALSEVLIAQEAPEKALLEAERALDSYERVDREDLRSFRARAAVARAQLALGKAQEALGNAKLVSPKLVLMLPPDEDYRGALFDDLYGLILMKLGKLDEARDKFMASGGRRDGRLEWAQSQAHLANLAAARGDHAQAVARHQQAVESLAKRLSPKDLRLVEPLVALAVSQAATGDAAAAKASLKRAWSIASGRSDAPAFREIVRAAAGRLDGREIP